jgi:putative NADPH-quinone reductase
MKVLIVFAHQETRSFNTALLARSVAELTALGHAVRISDLYAMGFNPVATSDDFGMWTAVLLGAGEGLRIASVIGPVAVIICGLTFVPRDLLR